MPHVIRSFQGAISPIVKVRRIKHFETGRLVEIEAEIDKGASAIVYNGKLGTQSVAVKRIPLTENTYQKLFNFFGYFQLARHLPSRSNVRGEIYRLSQCQHSNVLDFIDAFTYKHSIWIITERCRYTLRILCITSEKFLNDFCSPTEVINFVFAQICRAVAHIHSLNIVHMDLKPENILLTDDLVPKIADFGISTSIKQPKLSGGEMGTPGYIAPEIIRKDLYDCKADVWSLAIIYSNLLRGDWVPRSWQDYKENNILKRLDWNTENVDIAIRNLYICNTKGMFAEYYSAEQKKCLTLLATLLRVNPENRLTSANVCKLHLVKSNLQILDKHGSQCLKLEKKLRLAVSHQKVRPSKEMLQRYRSLTEYIKK